MVSLWHKIFGTAAKSNETAKSRLHFVLVQDRTGLDSGAMASFKEELMEVIERYFKIDKDAFDIQYKREGDESALVINSPVAVKKAKSKANMKKSIEVESTPQPAA